MLTTPTQIHADDRRRSLLGTAERRRRRTVPTNQAPAARERVGWLLVRVGLRLALTPRRPGLGAGLHTAS